MDTILQYEKRLKWRNISARLTHLTSFLPETQQREELEGALAKLAQLQKLSGVDVDTLSQA
ncbi:uncharacterized protein A1O5_09739 [Cladophialophora psammophila CBS 110553]|uniref:Prion-inhibition and propagation HeLo domain-containing protein n=1 Tax=Cladophialophora psammophila CBS 110553 TaxID=1182543 RepID=W9WGP5_9EURO|nr:uncharacterized protein A1O5_09739 [Cladophialophora psammophila CBS 110553]EXJ67093.1 hypothetical protein A1O5_09739 [Cladophialophora psammophila CBS 110553]